MIKIMLYMFVAAVFMVTMGLYGIDREMARQDYNDGKIAEHCIFQSNCDYYNKMEMGDD